MTAVLTRGRDVSHYQGAVNWKTLKATDDLSFGMAKCTEGLGFFDSQYAANRAGCRAAGMPFIPYHYAAPSKSSNGVIARTARRVTRKTATTVQSSARTQAARLIAKAGDVDGYCLDLEVSNLSQADTNAWMREFGDALRDLAPGVPTFVYLGGYAANGSGQGSVDHFDHWIYPHYTVTRWPVTYAPQVGGNTTGWKVPPAPAVWQCSDNIRGMDALVSNLTLPQLFSGADMPISAADMDTIFNTKIIPSKRIDPATGKPSGDLLSLSAFIASIDVNVVDPTPAAVAEIAAAVVAALPPSSGGSAPTADQIAAAVVAQFATKLGGAA